MLTAAGIYVLTGLPIGEYRVIAQRTGFKQYVQEPVVIATASTTTLNITFEVGEVTDTVSVTESVLPLIQTDNAETATVVENRVVMDLPLQVSSGTSGRRQIENFIFLSPGVTGDFFTKTFNGSTNLSNMAMVDGIAWTNGEVPGRFFEGTPPFEAVQEFKVASTLHPPEVGRAFGVTNYTLKSGTNRFHGNGFWFIREDNLDARGFFQAQKSQTTQNEFGGTIGGPIIKDKTFFFGSYSGFRLKTAGAGTQLLTLPPTDFRRGDFSRLRDAGGNLIQLYDPQTTRPDGSGGFIRDPFPANIIPEGRVSAVAKRYIDLMPAPDNNNIRGNFLSRRGGPQRDNRWSAKIDHNFNANHKVSYSHWHSFHPGGQAIGDYGADHPLDNGFPGGGTYFGMRANYDWIVSPTVLNHFGFGWSGTSGHGRGICETQGNQQLQVPGIPTDVPCIPAMVIGGYTEFGNAQQAGDARWDQTRTFLDTVSWTKGKHQMKFGGEVWFQTFRDISTLPNGGIAGTAQFSNLETDNPASPTYGSAGDGFASFFLGQVDSSQRFLCGPSEEPCSREHRFPYLAFHFNDTIQLTPKLTLSAGLRYDLPFPGRFTDENRLSAISLTLPNPVAGGRPGAYVFGNAALVPSPYKKEFGPRLSLAYQLNNQTVIRAGYGIIYAQTNALAQGNFQLGNGFQAGFSGFQTLVNTTSGVQPVFLLDNGYPAFTGTLPNQNAGIQVGGVADYYAPSGRKQSYVQSWQLSLQRELPFQSFIDVAYVGNASKRLPSALENGLNQVPFSFLSLGALLNQPYNSPDAIAAGIRVPYAGFSGSVAQSLRPFPQYTGINDLFQPIGFATYHSLQMKYQKRFSKGLSYLVSYTLQKTITDTSNEAYATFNAGARDTARRGLEKSIGNLDRTHLLVASFVYDLPGSNLKGTAGKVLGGWSASAVAKYYSGLPLSIGGGGPIPLFAGGNRPNRVPGADQRTSVSRGEFKPGGAAAGGTPYLNINAWSQPAPFTLGNGSRTEPNLRGFPLMSEDFSLIKRTYITESANVEFRAEFFNLFNRVIFGNPNTNTNDPINFGRSFNQANMPRQIQFGMKINF
ncbi:MAG: carboxypeptidase-like regulatory domain-containing protein [Acidobacteria bacterium]|nr:carboxypeptidase-like regulatory domain-containing protein [Acidobacteriota bacterium]